MAMAQISKFLLLTIWNFLALIIFPFAYELGWGRFLYQNRLFRRDEELWSCNFFHQRPSWGRNQPNTVLNTKSQYFEYNFGLRDEIGSDGYSSNIKVYLFYETKLSHFEHFFIWGLLNYAFDHAKIWCQHMPPCFSAKLACRKITCTKFVLRTMSTLHRPFIFLRAIIMYRPCLWKLSHFEHFFIWGLLNYAFDHAKIWCQHMPPCFSAKLACRKITCTKFVLRTMSTLHRPFIFLRAIIMYRPCLC